MGSTISLCDNPAPPMADPFYSNRSKTSSVDGEEEVIVT